MRNFVILAYESLRLVQDSGNYKTNYQMMNIRTKSILVLILLGIVDVVIPIPIIGLMLIYVIVQKPSWLLDLAQEIYRLG